MCHVVSIFPFMHFIPFVPAQRRWVVLHWVQSSIALPATQRSKLWIWLLGDEHTVTEHTCTICVCIQVLYIYMYCYVICGVNSVTRIPDIIQLVGDTIPWYVAYDWYVLFLNSALSPSLGLQPRSLHLQSPCGEVRRLGSPRSPRMP